MKLSFEGAAQTVTGSQTVVSHNDFSFLVDCGLYQGPKALRLLNWEQPPYFEDIRAIVLTHAHIDHSGLLPRWTYWDWKGPIYCTPSTADLLSIMLLDSARLQEEDARFANEKKHSKHDPALPLYTEKDAERAIRMLKPIPFGEWQSLNPQIQFRFLRAGHILGSAIVQIKYEDQEQEKTITFSGDLGGGHSQILKNPETIDFTNTLILESTYGDRKVESQGREERLAEVVNKVFQRGGTLVIPAFALGRTQDLLLSLLQLNKKKAIPEIPIYLDSPMANAVTKVYFKNLRELQTIEQNPLVEESLTNPNFTGTESPDDSMLLCMSDEPKIVISASGMLQGGRVLHHLKHKLPNKKNGVLFVGFQGKETKGRLLQEGIQTIRIHHQEISVEAEIFTLEGYSAHGDSEDLIAWLKTFKKLPEKIFLNHGEFEAQKVFAQKIKEEFNIIAEIPALHQTFEI